MELLLLLLLGLICTSWLCLESLIHRLYEYEQGMIDKVNLLHERSPRLLDWELNEYDDDWDTLKTLASSRKITEPMLVLFTTWKENITKYEIHNSTMRSWQLLLPWIQPVVFADDISIVKQATAHGWKVMPMHRTAPNGKPLLKDMFIAIEQRFKRVPLIGFSNADILYSNTLLETLLTLMQETPAVLAKPGIIAGARTNVENLTSAEVATWKSLSRVAKERGTQFRYFYAADYFITTRSYPYGILPDIAVGLPEYDNFMIWFSNINNISTIDVTNTVLAVHWTTTAGNMEGFLSKDKFYNRRIFQTKFLEFAPERGLLHCTKYLTATRAFKNQEIILLRRNVIVGICVEKYKLEVYHRKQNET